MKPVAAPWRVLPERREVFRVGGITNFADDAGGNDQLSTATEWIFSSFRAGLLTGYRPDEIQGAIWTLEDEWTSSTGNSAALIALAQSRVAAGWVNDGVAVLNLFYTDGRMAQDQLTFTKVANLPPPPPDPTPEPATLALVGLGAMVVVAGRLEGMMGRPLDSRRCVATSIANRPM